MNTKREIPYLQATMYYFVYYINILLTRGGRPNSCFKKRTHCHSFTALNRASDISAVDWLSQTHVKKYGNFSRAVTRFFSVVEIPTLSTPVYIINIVYVIESATYGVIFITSCLYENPNERGLLTQTTSEYNPVQSNFYHMSCLLPVRREFSLK